MAAKCLWVGLFSVAAGLLFMNTGEAIKCFNCNSFHQADCVDWFDNVTNHLVECFSWQTKCRKIVQEAWFNDHWDVRYIRQCAGDDSVVGSMQGRMCQERFGSYNVRIRYCHCDNQDGCNSAPVVTSFNMAGLCRTLVLALCGLFGPWVMLNRRGMTV